MGSEVIIPHSPMRVISLVPSQTELLFDLGLEDKIAGLTKFCIHPADSVKSKPIIGGTKNFRFDKIDEIQPDLIIGNKEENYESGINQLKKKYPVWMSDIYDLNDSLNMITSIGTIFRVEDKANRLVNSIRTSFDQLPEFKKLTCLYFIWNKPKMVVGKDTFINKMLQKSGFENLISPSRYPELSLEELENLQPQVVLLSSEPFPFKKKHLEEFEELFPKSKILIVDGELFSWYGSRLLKTADYFKQLRAKLDPLF
ncbi:ABC transporter substrate-binding protein [Fulvivirga lutea]|uniref:ABC transporter substrate-binding protein n=2 Tax=Fulvivirga lutea TaxID=2810512 RepID=A0A974WK55_9BACT|nr:ABC transporter substrate-binding protein [Fulvivirga lutea]